MEALEAVIAVLGEEGKPLHWTVILDRALERGYLDPFTDPDLRRKVLTALAEASRAGTVTKVAKGVYSLP